MIRYWKSHLVRLFLILQIVSLSGMYFTKDYYILTSGQDYINLFLVAALTLLVVLPWNNMNKFTEIKIANPYNLRLLTKILLWISLYVIIIDLLAIISLYSNISVHDINEFKYGGSGLREHFGYSLSMVNVKLKIIANYLYYFSLILIPLHFYYISKGEIKLSILCLLGSLGIIFHGLAYYSRVTSVHWIFLYVSLFIFTSNAIHPKHLKNLKKGLVLFIIAVVLQFIVIGSYRFLEYKGIGRTSIIQDAQIYSAVHYLSQSFKYGMSTLKDYNYQTFQGQLSLIDIYSLLSIFGIIDWDYDTFYQLRRQLWPTQYYTFNGLVSYSIYDYGYILTFLLFIGYYYFIKSIKSNFHSIYLTDLLIVFILIQIPLFAIFYSAVRGIAILSVLLIPIIYILKSRRNFKLKI